MNIRDYQQFSYGGADWSEAFRQAISDLRAQGGGVLNVPAGVYPTGSIRLYDNMTLNVEAGARIAFLQDDKAYPLIIGEYQGDVGLVHQSCLYAQDAKHITVTGYGTLDGQGEYWWEKANHNDLPYPRPHLICFHRCEHVVLENVSLINSPVWTVHPLRCRNVVCRGLNICNPYHSPNTDGIDPDGCQDVRISDCTIDVGDDCIAIKSGTEKTPDAQPSERIIITNCHFLRGHGGVVLGSEMSGGVRNVVVSSCVFSETDRGIRLKTRRGRGGTVEGIQLNNLVMEKVVCPFVFNMYYGGRVAKPEEKYYWDKAPLPVDEHTPRLRDVSISGVRARGVTGSAGFFYGLPEMPVEDVSIRDVIVEMGDGYVEESAQMANSPDLVKAGFYLRNANNVELKDVRVIHAVTDTLLLDDSVTMAE
ncbi:MAG: glycoside hydrolase family 28 protein [Clostridia bacterium]|nr:glycoside hydrolase family 28 protein [Clostridia bacterium]